MDLMIAIAFSAVFGIYALNQRAKRIEAEDEAQALREELADARRVPPTVGTRGAGGGGRR